MTEEQLEINDALARCIALVEKQAEDEGLWFIAETAPEEYVQRALRELHDLVEKAWELV